MGDAVTVQGKPAKFRLFCDQCHEDGNLSTVRMGQQRVQASIEMWPQYWWDEQGRYHTHTTNHRDFEGPFNCSNGHTFWIPNQPECWCMPRVSEEQVPLPIRGAFE